MSAVCRACLLGDARMYSLESHILDIYGKLTNTKLSARGPQAVCYICHSLLQRCHRFAEMALCSENTLQHFLDRGIEATHENIIKLSPTTRSSLSASSMQIMVLNNIENSVDTPHIKEEYDTSEEDFAVKEEFTVEEPVAAAEDFPPVVNRPLEYLTESSVSESAESNQKEEFIVEEPVDAAEEFPPVLNQPFEYLTDSSLSESSESNQKKTLSAHIKTHNLVTYVCDICNHIFTSKGVFRKHMFNHIRKRYICDICGRQYSWKGNLAAHIVTHTSKKIKNCDKCGKSYSQKSHLTVHMRTHTGERPYACQLCSIKFSIKQNLIVHMITHTGERPYACDVCDKIFSRKYSMTRHSNKCHET